MNKLLAVGAAFIAMASTISSSSADVLVVYESFSQASGPLDGQMGEQGLNTWSTSGSPAASISAPTLKYGDLARDGGQVSLPNSPGTDAWVTTTSALADANLLDDGATLWFSYMFSKPIGGGSNEWAGFAFGSERLDAAFSGINMLNGGNGVGVSTRNNAVRVATWLGGGNASQGDSISFNYLDSVLVVGKIEWGMTAMDDERITIYTPSTSDLENLGAGVSKTVSGFDQSLLDTISFSQRNSTGTQIYDEIRFGDTFAAVTPVPEPSSLAVLGIAGLALMNHRRRRK